MPTWPGGIMLNPEQAEVLGIFIDMLRAPTGDGGVKRAAGLKPSWKVDTSHETAMFSHINKWKHGERRDATSGAHPLVHLAWRALAIAWQESQVPATLTFQQYHFPPKDAPPITMDQDDMADTMKAIAEAGITPGQASLGSIEAQHKLEREQYARKLELNKLIADEERRLSNPVIHPDPEGLIRARQRAANRIID